MTLSKSDDCHSVMSVVRRVLFQMRGITHLVGFYTLVYTPALTFVLVLPHFHLQTFNIPKAMYLTYFFNEKNMVFLMGIPVPCVIDLMMIHSVLHCIKKKTM